MDSVDPLDYRFFTPYSSSGAGLPPWQLLPQQHTCIWCYTGTPLFALREKGKCLCGSTSFMFPTLHCCGWTNCRSMSASHHSNYSLPSSQPYATISIILVSTLLYTVGLLYSLSSVQGVYSLYCLLLCFVGVNQSFLLNTSSYLASIHGVRYTCSVKTLYEQCVMSWKYSASVEY